MPSNPYIGEIYLFAGNFAPKGYAFCSGQLIPISQNTALFSILGTTYGGDGQTTFALPDLRGRAALGAGQGPGLSNFSLGQQGGTQFETLSAAQMPAHTHAVNAQSGAGNQRSPAGTVWAQEATAQTAVYSSAAPNSTMSGNALSSSGGGQPQNNMQPYLGLSYVIAIQGIFPSRN